MTAADFLKEKTNTLEFQFANFEDINMIFWQARKAALKAADFHRGRISPLGK